MIGCHSTRHEPSQNQQQQQQPASHILHQQTSMYTHVSPVFGAPYSSNDNLISNSNQLIRSKSLNDISNDSQLVAFDQAPSTYLHLNPNFQNFGDDTSIFNPQGIAAQTNLNNLSHNQTISVAPQCMNTVGSINNPIYNNYNHEQQHQQQQNCRRNNLGSIHSNDANINNNGQFNASPHASSGTDIYGNQCSTIRTPTQVMPASTSGPTANPSTTPANMFNICNPLAMNLNGVTEQIGNLHL